MAKKPNKTKAARDKKAGAKDKDQAPGAGLAYPIWASVIVCLVLTVWIAGSGFFAVTLYAAVQGLKKATDQVYIARNVDKIAKFEDPLPKGFKYTFSGVPFRFNLVTIGYEPDNSVFVIGTKPEDDLKTTDARQIVDNPLNFGLPKLYGDMNIEKKGSMQIAGEKLEYVTGTTSDQEQRTIGGFIGCAILKNKSALIVYALTPPGESTNERKKDGRGGTTFDMYAAEKLFSAIKGF